MLISRTSSTIPLRDLSGTFEWTNALSIQSDRKKEGSPTIATVFNLIKTLCESIRSPGIHSAVAMHSAGFQYTGDGDTASCKECGLKISNWTKDMKPFTIHSKQKPDCSFIQSVMPSSLSNVPISSFLSIAVAGNISLLDGQENPSKRIKNGPRNFMEATALIQVRRRTFSHWPHRATPSGEQMIEAGFFYCSVGDRVICMYCNLICEQWIQTDDPCEVHKTFSPRCNYIMYKLMRPAASRTIIINERSASATSANQLLTPNDLDTLRSNQIVFKYMCCPDYAEMSKRRESFATWPNEDLISVNDLVSAGFFYEGKGTIVTCFYCNGFIQIWGPIDNPMIEHAQRFPLCAYAKQLCGAELFHKIQESKRAQQGMFQHKKLFDKILSVFLSRTC